MKNVLNSFLAVLLSAIICVAQGLPNQSATQTIEKNAMRVQWTVLPNSIEFEVFAPSQGWLAIGLNRKAGLVGTNLIMGKVQRGHCILSDQFILAPGDHQPVENLGGNNHLSNVTGSQTAQGTILKFSLASSARDKYHLDLIKGETYYLLIAYSAEDDFQHHSRMRTSLKITL